MPNTGMLDHWALYRLRPGQTGRSQVHWMSAWPPKTGYQTVRAVQSAKVASFSRYLNSTSQPPMAASHSRPGSSTPRLAMENSVSPFHTAMKHTCGFFFSRETDHRKHKMGIPPSDLVSWRSTSAHAHRGMTA